MKSKEQSKRRAQRGARFIDREQSTVYTLKHGIRKKVNQFEFRVLPRDVTVMRDANADGISQTIVVGGDIRPSGCDILAHGTEREKIGFASRIVLTLRVSDRCSLSKARQRLYYTGGKYGFRVYPIRDDNGDETEVYTLAVVSADALRFLHTALWVDSLGETQIRLPGNGSIEHIARKPKRKRSSFHPDYVRSQSGIGRAPRHIGKTEPRIY